MMDTHAHGAEPAGAPPMPTPPPTPPTADTAPTTGPAYAHPAFWLTATAVTYALTHHVGVAMAWLGTIGPTRWADWIDLLTPYAVLLPAAAALHTGGADRRAWALYLTGALTYVEGHGIHLAANSVGNHTPNAAAHLWDEVVGHYIWYGERPWSRRPWPRPWHTTRHPAPPPDAS
ncbi:hypothetical protein [Actinomadura keratinilytica]|uniref:hypothetical protein n=1 Tax=Actinomadura keratinilytica TaxID=547461 RepID=UPI003620E8BA